MGGSKSNKGKAETRHSPGQPHVATDAAVADPELPPSAFPVVGMVASAGGLDAFKKFFQAMPPNSGMAFVLIPHLDPRRESLMPELVAKQTAMPVEEVAKGTRVQPNHVYVLPPNAYLAIRDSELRLSGPVERGGPQTSIDLFLRSLAEDQQEKAICIILSGTGSHGALGLKAIKANGGMAMVQEPTTAEYDRMPQSAIATGLADYVLPVEKMPEALIDYVGHFLSRPMATPPPVATAPDDNISQVLALLKARTQFDFRAYRKRMLLRRIQRRMGLNHLGRMADYLTLLRERPEEIKQLSRDLLICVTSFFRDPEMYQVLEANAISELVRGKFPEASLRVWITGCATGEEAYSIAMLFLEQMAATQATCQLQVFATDVEPEALDVARRGVYPDTVVADIGPERLQRFFAKVDDHSYQVNKQLRETVLFAAQNLLGDPPFSRLDLISCRNVLIYLEPEVQQKVLLLLHFALNEGGYLVLGPSETVGKYVNLFEPVSKKWRIYRRVTGLKNGRVEFPIVVGGSAGTDVPVTAATVARTISLAELTEQVLLEEYVPAAVVINRNYDVLYFHGPTARYLQQPPGVPTQDLNALAAPGLRCRVRAVVHKVLSEGQRATLGGGRTRRDGRLVSVRVTARPLLPSRAAPGLLLVIFEDEVPQGEAGEGEAPAGDGSLARRLEHELKTTREELQSAIEELESSNEELKASNEEVLSMNEELQSANEELETSKEELHSLNEELSTVNSQLQEKVEELENINSDMANLLNSADIATIFLGADRRIRRFTPAATRLFNLIAGDVGRPIGDITARFSDPSLHSDVDRVLKSLSPSEKEVGCKDGRWYIRRIMPYRTTDHRFDGVVITFTDVSALKKAEAQLRELAGALEQRVAERTAQLGAEIGERHRAQAQALARASELAHLHRLHTAGEMATALAHELGQPLSAIASYGEASLRTLKRGEIDKQRLGSNLERITAQAQRAGRIIRDLRNFLSKDDADRVAVELNRLVHSTAELVEIEVRKRAVRIEFDLDENLPPVLAQPIQIEHVLVNLLHNAVEAMADTKTPAISIASRTGNDGMVRVTVRDSGPGLDEEALKHLFDPFYTTKRDGLGLGLAISRTLVEAHGGRIWAEAGAGGIFHFTLPIAP